MTIATYDGTDTTLLIKHGTDPWIEILGGSVNWIEHLYGGVRRLARGEQVDNDCEVCEWETVPGVLTAMNDAYGIQRCDTCERFEGDLDAALALANLVDGVVKFETEEDRP